MIERTLARRYARALLDTAVRRKAVRAVEAQILAVAQAYEGSRELRGVLGHPAIPQAKKIELLRKVFEARVEPELMEFLVILVERHRVEYLPEIATVFDALADEYEGLVRVEVATFAPLTEGERKSLLQTLSGVTGGRQIALTEKEEKGLLGGLAVRIGDVLVDGSVAGRLKRLKENLAAQARNL